MFQLLAGAALGAGQWALQNVGNRKNAKIQFERQKQLNQQQFNYNQQLAEQQHKWQTAENERAFNREKEWALNEREYNTPHAQLERLRAAGINPAVGIDNMQNTVSQPLNMSADAGGSASVGGSSASMPQTAQFPELTSIMQGLKGLELMNSQINESQSRANYYNSLSENVAKDIEKKELQMPFWSDIGKYDVEFKKNNAQSIYRDILDKTWRYDNLFPLELKKMRVDIAHGVLQNKFDHESFKDRLNSIIYGNELKTAQKDYYGDLKRNINSEISYRDFAVDQMEKNGAAARSLQFSQEQINKAKSQIMELQKSANESLSKGNYLEAFHKMMMINFLSQAMQGSIVRIPSPMDLGADAQTINRTIGALGFLIP